MTIYDLNDSITFAVTVKDSGGTAVDPTSIAVAILKPDGTLVTPAVVPANPGVGQYEAVVAATSAGQWQATWTSTDPTASYVDVATVRPATDRMLISLDDARRHLNLSSRASDEELREQVMVASDLICGLIGPVLPTTKTQVVAGGRTILPLDYRIVSVSLVTQYPGGTVSASNGSNRGYRIDGKSGLELVSGMTPVRWAANVSVTYVAGYATVPPTIRQATRELTRHLWDTQRGPLAPRSIEPEGWMSGQGFTLPRRVVELLDMTPSAV